jgi:tetratricopeptide (TPR) repeat protein
MTKKFKLSVMEDQKKLLVEINGLYLFQGYQVMEAFTPDMDECYYLFFYKNKFLTGRKTIKLKLTSTLTNVLTKGIYLSPLNPIIENLLAINSIHTFPTLNKNWKLIKKEYDAIEAAHILTVFDSYLKKDIILNTVKEMWLNFRRDGKFLQAFRILKLLLTKYPKNQWAQSLITHIDYQKYSLHYQSEIESLLHYDPLFSENQLYLQLDSDKSFNTLREKLQSESRFLECLSLYCYRLTYHSDNFEQHLSDLLDLPISHIDITMSSILSSIYSQSRITGNKEKILSHLLSQLVANKQFENAFSLIIENKMPFSQKQTDLLLEIINHLDASFIIPFKDFSPRYFIDANFTQIEQLFEAILPHLFEYHDIEYIYKWSQPLHDVPSLIINNIKTMYKIKEEPEQQHVMGELYYQLNQPRQAIDCFLWDAELNPTNPRPIKWLTKLYQGLGMADESTSYQYLYKQIQKSS